MIGYQAFARAAFGGTSGIQASPAAARRSLPALGLFAAVAAAWPAWASAQRSERCDFDTSAATVRVPAVFFLEPSFDVDPSPAARSQAVAYIESLTRYFEPPRQLAIGLRPIVTVEQLGADPEGIHYPIGGPLLIPLRQNGKLGRGHPIAASAIPALNEALVDAVKRREAAGPMPTADWAAQSKRGPVQLTITAAAAAPPGVVPLMQVVVPAFRAEHEAVATEFPRPEYPPDARKFAPGARVDVRFVVGEDGRAEPGTIELLSVSIETTRDFEATAAAFARSAVKAILGARFEPARVQGCPVRVMDHHRVTFRIG